MYQTAFQKGVSFEITKRLFLLLYRLPARLLSTRFSFPALEQSFSFVFIVVKASCLQ